MTLLPYPCAACGTVQEAGLGGPAGWLRVNEGGYPADYLCSRACLAAWAAAPAETTGPVLTAHVGLNAPLFAAFLRLYARPGARVLDMTYGRGGFWRSEGLASEYGLVRMDRAVPGCDLYGDFTRPPFRPGTFDVVALDPPYANNGSAHSGPMAEGVARQYNLTAGLSTTVIHGLYRDGITAAAALVTRGGVLMVKCQDGIESGRRHWTHGLVQQWAEAAGFEAIDQGVLVSSHRPPMRHGYQQHARTNHSFLWVFRQQAAPQQAQLELVV